MTTAQSAFRKAHDALIEAITREEEILRAKEEEAEAVYDAAIAPFKAAFLLAMDNAKQRRKWRGRKRP